MLAQSMMVAPEQTASPSAAAKPTSKTARDLFADEARRFQHLKELARLELVKLVTGSSYFAFYPTCDVTLQVRDKVVVRVEVRECTNIRREE